MVKEMVGKMLMETFGFLLAREAQHMGTPIGMFRSRRAVVVVVVVDTRTFILEEDAGELKENSD
jgi:hypothetical protein